MLIKVFPRKFFLDIKGKKTEDDIISQWNIISICTPEYLPKSFEKEEPPFSSHNLSNDSILILYFHDSDFQANRHVVLFTEKQAMQIFDFVRRTMSNGKGYIIHCTAGISRSQAVGLVLNEFLNRLILKNQDDYDRFEIENQYHRRPNSLVKRLLWNTFENNLEKLQS